MTIGIYGRSLHSDHVPAVRELFEAVEAGGGHILIHASFAEKVKESIPEALSVGTFEGYEELNKRVDKLISIGGDGTLLDTISFVMDSGVPILGLNTGRLGFLAQTSKEDVGAAVEALLNDDHSIDPRSLISLKEPASLFGTDNVALNEFTLLKKNSSSMVTVNTYLDGEYLNSYWADGLIIATPTGSTAYSMSCGGPILAPNASDLIITPVAAHNLNIRPLVVPDRSRIVLEMEGRSERCLTTLDSRSNTVQAGTVLELQKADFTIDLVELKGQRFSETLRSKLLWGMDKRN
ncbi:MAG: NAD kinase [Flavobacteriales bacterium]